MELTIIAIAILFLLIQTSAKIHFLNIREGSARLQAEVLEYRKEKGPFRNDYTMLNYPYVKILTEGCDHDKIRRLRYASSWAKPFKVGQTINVFWYAGELLYWNAMERGIERYLPAKWPWKSWF